MPEQWYYSSRGRQVGPLSIEELREAAADGKLFPTDAVRRDGDAEPIPATNVTGLFSAASTPNPYMSPTLPAAGGGEAAFPDVTGAPAPPAISPLWNPKAAALWSLLFSWAFGSFLLARNWKALGDEERAKRCMLWFYGFFPFLIAAIVVSEFGDFAAFLRPAGIGIFVAWFITERTPQADYLEQRFGGRYPRKSWLMPIGVAICIVAGSFFAIVGVATAVSTAQSEATYGKELTFNGGQLFYKAPVTEAEANRLGKYLVAGKFFDGTPKSVQITKSGDRFDFHMVVAADFEPDQDQADGLEAFGGEMSKAVFDGAPVDISLCDDQLKTRQTIGADR